MNALFGAEAKRIPHHAPTLADAVIVWENWLDLAINIQRPAKGNTMADAEGEILTLDEVAVYLKAGKRTVYRLAQNGDIPAFKLGGTWRFRRTELDRWIAASIKKNPKHGKR